LLDLSADDQLRSGHIGKMHLLSQHTDLSETDPDPNQLSSVFQQATMIFNQQPIRSAQFHQRLSSQWLPGQIRERAKQPAYIRPVFHFITSEKRMRFA
jgi:hypothetical protein